MKYQDRSEEYNTPRDPSEIDLCKTVKEILIEASLGDHLRPLDEYIEQTRIADKKPQVQRFYLNRFIFMQLLMASMDTMESRYCLVNDGEISDWIYLFKKKILPIFIECGLPL